MRSPFSVILDFFREVYVMEIRKCTVLDIDKLTELNKQLIDDEKSDNRMNFDELRTRMKTFLETDYSAYFFAEENAVVGYALIKNTSEPLYLRQFLIDRNFRRKHLGKMAFELLLKELNTNTIDIEVLSRNEAGLKFWESCGFVERSRYMRLKK